MRLANRLLGALLALAVMAGGVVLIVEVIASAAGHRPALVPWHTAYDWARRTTWAAGGVRVACGVLIALGLILLIAELKPARVTRLVAEPADAGVRTSIPPTLAAGWPRPSGRRPSAWTASAAPR